MKRDPRTMGFREVGTWAGEFLLLPFFRTGSQARLDREQGKGGDALRAAWIFLSLVRWELGDTKFCPISHIDKKIV